MAITSGFFNSVNEDRKYDARQISEIFDGIVNDGVYYSIGEHLQTFPGSAANTVMIGTGRAWFNHVWVKVYPNRLMLTLNPPDSVYARYDAVVIEIDHSNPVRKGNIKVITGTPSSSPAYPTLVRNTGEAGEVGVNQYPLAYILRPANTPNVTASHIKFQNALGSSACPYVTGPLTVLKTDDFWVKWMEDWDAFLAERGEETDEFLAQQQQIFNQHIFDINEENHEWITETHEAFEEFWQDSAYKVTDLIQQNQMEFTEWFEELQVTLEGDVAANLAAKILRIDHDLDTLAREQTIYRYIEDSDGESVLDSNEQLIGSATVFELKHIF